MGGVGLPALVGQLRLEPDEGAPGPLVGLWGDEPPPPEDPPDGRDRRHRVPAHRQVVVDGLCAGVQTLVGELLSQRHDLVLQLGAGAVGDVLRRLRPRLDRGVAAVPEPLEELRYPTLGDPVGPGNLPIAPALKNHRLDHVPCQIHRRPPSQVSTMLRHMCPLSCELRHHPQLYLSRSIDLSSIDSIHPSFHPSID